MISLERICLMILGMMVLIDGVLTYMGYLSSTLTLNEITGCVTVLFSLVIIVSSLVLENSDRIDALEKEKKNEKD